MKLLKETKQILKNRGINTDNESELQALLDDNLLHQHNPALLKNGKEFCQILIDKVEQNWRENKYPLNITIYGDYDADGITGTTVCVKSLNYLFKDKVKVNWYINDRFSEGYGINEKGMQSLLKKAPNTQLIITVDNGILGFDGVDYANEHNIPVLITDHHKQDPSGKLPDALVVVDSHQKNETYPFADISGCTVAYKVFLLASKILKDKQAEQNISNLSDIVGISVISDVMPLRNENRLFVKDLIKRVNSNPWGSRVAIREMLLPFIQNKKAKLPIDEETIKFCLAPLINASSRVTGKSDIPMKIFLSTNLLEIKTLCNTLYAINEQRKAKTNSIIDTLMKTDFDATKKVLIYYADNIGDGIIGLVAGKLTEQYHRPAIVLTKDGNIYKGSGRSIAGFDITDSLYQLNKTKSGLIQFGGHAGACGLSVRADHIRQFIAEYEKVVNDTLNNDLLAEKITYDAILDHVNLYQLLKELALFKPYGQDFVVPTFLYKHFNLNKIWGMPYNKIDPIHLKIKDKTTDLQIIDWFGYQDFIKKLKIPNNLKINELQSVYDELLNQKQYYVTAIGNLTLNNFDKKPLLTVLKHQLKLVK